MTTFADRLRSLTDAELCVFYRFACGRFWEATIRSVHHNDSREWRWYCHWRNRLARIRAEAGLRDLVEDLEGMT